MKSRSSILQLEYDVLKEIFLLVVACVGGATDLANIMAVCKAFAKLGNDKCILKMVNFENFALPESAQNWLHTKSLLIRCAEAGHARAQYILAKVVLLWYWQLLDLQSGFNRQLRTLPHTDQESSQSVSLRSFLSYFTLDQEMHNNPNIKRFTHFELVSLFLKQCSIADYVSMLPYVQIYVDCFGSGNKKCMKLVDCFQTMTGFLQTIVDAGRTTQPNLLLINTNGQIELEMRNAYELVDKLRVKVSNFFRSMNGVRSWPHWEMLKRECHCMDGELLFSVSCANSIDENYKIADLGKKLLYYFAFNGLVAREIDLPVEGVVADLWKESYIVAQIYTTWQEKIALAFDDMFLL